jgi:hypothetical protein
MVVPSGRPPPCGKRSSPSGSELLHTLFRVGAFEPTASRGPPLIGLAQRLDRALPHCHPASAGPRGGRRLDAKLVEHPDCRPVGVQN